MPGFNIDIVWLITSIVGISGIGFIALLFIAPTAAAVIGQFLTAFFSTKLGLSILMLAIGLFVGDVYRASHDREVYKVKLEANNAKWKKAINDAADKFQVARVERDDDVDKTINNVVDEATKEINNRAVELQKELKDNAKLKSRGDCVLTSSDIGWMRIDQKPISRSTKP